MLIWLYLLSRDGSRSGSLSEYLGVAEEEVCERELILANSQEKNYEKFVFDHADYQRSLEQIKHLLYE